MADSYSAGNLELSLQVIGKETLTVFESVSKILDKITPQIENISKYSDTLKSFSKIKTPTIGENILKSADGKEIKKTVKELNEAGNLVEKLYKDGKLYSTKTVDTSVVGTKNVETILAQQELITNTWSDQVYSLDNLGNSYLKLQKIYTQTGEALKVETIQYNEQGEEIKRLLKLKDELGNITTKTLLDYKEPFKTSTTTDNVYALDDYGNSLLKVSTITTKTADGVTTVTKELDKQGKVLKRTTTFVDNYGNKTVSVLDKTTENKSLKNFNINNFFGKVTYYWNITKRVRDVIRSMVSNGVNYLETLNLWQVAMRGNRKEAELFVEQMEKAYGFASTTLMQYQATFRNMLSALGGISENISYQLSEFLVQMAADYASLYNTSIDKAMTVFQSVLSGQVRPIRTISGYDITETTIYQLYQQLGGTKTMRQLTQTEKRLLRIYAVFQQMESSGAVGDLRKTIETTANQSRVMTEQFKELGTWLGLLFNQVVEPWLPYINAILMTVTNVVKAIAKGMGAGNFEGGIGAMEEMNDQLDEATGKLLSFDRFEALNSASGENNLGVDENLIAGLSKYESILNDVTMKATELAEKWTKWWVGDDGKLTEQADLLINTLKYIGITIGFLIGLRLLSKIYKIISSVGTLKALLNSLNTLLVGGIIFAIIAFINAISKGKYWLALLFGVIAAGLIVLKVFITIKQKQKKVTLENVAAIVAENNALLKNKIATKSASATASLSIKKVSSATDLLWQSISALAIGFAGGMLLLQLFPEGEARKTASIIMIIVGAVVALTAAIVAMNTALTFGQVLPYLLAGVGLAFAGVYGVADSYTARKTGGAMYEDGLFTVSRGEIMGKFDDGTTVVANNQQITTGIENAAYRGYTRAMRESNGGYGGKIDVYLDKTKVGQGVAQSANREMRRVGMLKASR